MFNIGGGELLVIMLIALLVLGPSRLPEAARQMGKVMGDLRKMSTGFQNEMRSALNDADDPTRTAARRNVLAKEAPTPGVPASVTEAVQAVSASASARPPGPVQGSGKKASTAGRASARNTPAKKPATANGARATTATAKKASATKATAKKPTATTKATKATKATKSPAKNVPATKAPATKAPTKKSAAPVPSRGRPRSSS